MLPTGIAQSIAGQAAAERAESLDKKKTERPAARDARIRKDEHDTVTVETEAAEAVRHLAGNDQEQAREDRREHPGYTPSGLAPGSGKPRLDIEG